MSFLVRRQRKRGKAKFIRVSKISQWEKFVRWLTSLNCNCCDYYYLEHVRRDIHIRRSWDQIADADIWYKFYHFNKE